MIIKFHSKEVSYVEDDMGNTLLSEIEADNLDEMGELKSRLEGICQQARLIIFGDYTEERVDGVRATVRGECIYLR